MIFIGYFAGVIGGLLLLGSIGLAIYVQTNGREVKTWKPFGWSGFLGFLILARVAFSGPVPPSRHCQVNDPEAALA